jgi:hypothetical protein
VLRDEIMRENIDKKGKKHYSHNGIETSQLKFS